MCPPFRLRPNICLGVIGGMLTQHEVCLDVSVDTTLGYRLPAGSQLARFFARVAAALCFRPGILLLTWENGREVP